MSRADQTPTLFDLGNEGEVSACEAVLWRALFGIERGVAHQVQRLSLFTTGQRANDILRDGP